MVKIKPARRPPPRAVSRARTPLRKISRPARPKSILGSRPKNILSGRTPSRLNSAQKRTSAPSQLAQKIKNFFWASVGILCLLSVSGFIIVKTFVSMALEDTSTRTVVLAPSTVSDTANQVVFAFLSEEQNDSFIAVLPGSVEVTVPGGYGQYRLSAVYPLLQLEKKDPQFIGASFSRSLGRTVETVYGTSGIVVGDESAQKIDSSQLFTLILSTALKQKRLPVELVRMWHFVKKDIPVVSISSLEELPGLVAEKKTSVVEHAQECPIGVLNASSQSGTASLLSTLYEQSGLITIRTSSYPQIEATTKIYVSADSTCQPVVMEVQKAFVKLPQIEINEAMVTQYRAPIVIIIGEDFQ